MYIFGVHKDIENYFIPDESLSGIRSFRWTEHFAEIGSFEIKIPFSDKLRDFLEKYKYVLLSGSTRPMRIRSVHIKKEDKVDVCTISGESLEYILKYRYLHGTATTSQTFVDNTLVHVPGSSNETTWNEYMTEVVRTYFLVNIYLRDRFRIRNTLYTTPAGIPSNPSSSIPRDPNPVWVDKGTSIYDFLSETHKASDKRVGFAYQVALRGGAGDYGRLHFTANSQRDFTDSTTDQALVFSNEDGTLLNSEYLYTEEEQYTGITAYMDYFTGNDNDTQRRNQTRYLQLTPEGAISGDDFERRMAYLVVNYKHLVESGQPPSINVAYNNARDNFKGEIPTDTYIEGEVSPNTDYVYLSDYHLGDIAWVQTPFGSYEKGRITTQTFIKDEKGITSFPTITDIGQI